MNTLKKTVAVVLAVAMVLTMGIATSFAAFNDVPSTANYAEAVNILSNLGIFNGYDDGSFKPNNTITRAEVAAVIVRALALTEQKGTTSFSDVAADHWASGYINTAYAQGVINGMGDGTFAPGADVTYEQVVKMVVAALGYEPKATSRGGYPTGYLAIASEEGISSGAAGTVGQPATRATVAKLIYNALEVGMMEQSTWGTSLEYSVDKDKTLLSLLGVEKIECVVTDTYYQDAVVEGYDVDNKDVELTLTKSVVTSDNKNNYKDLNGQDLRKGDSIVFQEGGTAAASLLGYSCVAYVGVDDETDDLTIYAISAKGSRNTVTTVSSELLAEKTDLSTSEEDKADNGTVYYWKNGKSDKNPTALSSATEVTVIKNYKNVTDEEAFAEKSGLKYVEDFGGDGGIVQFIDNDGDKKFDFVIATVYTDEGVVESVEENDGVWTFEASDVAGSVPTEVDTEDDEVLNLFIKGENYIDVSEIAAGDTITTISSENGAINVYKVSSDKLTDVKCTSTNKDAETATIAGKAYSLSPSFTKNESASSKLTAMRSVEGTFYINADGLIAGYDGSGSSTGVYGYLVGVDSETKYTKTSYEVRIIDAQGVSHDFGLASRVRVYDENNESGKAVDDDDAFAEIEALAASADPEKHIVKYTLDGNNISKFIKASELDSIVVESAKKEDYDAIDKTLGNADPFTDASVIFALDKFTGSEKETDVIYTNDDGSYNLVDEDSVSVGSISKFFANDNEYTAILFSENDETKAAIVFDPTSAIDANQNVFVVSGVSVDYDKDDNAMLTLTGIQDGKTRTVTLYDEDDSNVAEDYIENGTCTFTKGTVVLLGEEDGGYVTDMEILVTVTRDGNYLDMVEVTGKNLGQYVANGKDYSFYGYGEVTSYSSSDGVHVDGYTDVNNEKTAYNLQSGTNVVLVDLTATRITGATVKNGSKSSMSLGTEKNPYAVSIFFRTSDASTKETDEFTLKDNRRAINDVVVYRVAADDADKIGAAGSNVGGQTQSVNRFEDIPEIQGIEEIVETPVDDVVDVDIIEL